MSVRLLLLGLCLSLLPTNAFPQKLIYDEGDTALGSSEFHYTLSRDSDPGAEQNHLIFVRHLKEKYEGELAGLPFRDRHLRVFEMVAKLIKASCPGGVASLGNIDVSKDPEGGEDPGGVHPQYFAWEYSCK
jgi:hypothetical protein